MDWRSRLESVKAAAKTAHEMGTEVAGDAIEQHWPTIQRAMQEHVAPTATALVTNDELIELAARGLHKFLPLPVRFVIRPQRLTDWCLSNRDRVLAAIRSPANSEPNLPKDVV